MIIKFPFPVLQKDKNTVQVLDGPNGLDIPTIETPEKERLEDFATQFDLNPQQIEQALDKAQEAFVKTLIAGMIRVEI